MLIHQLSFWLLLADYALDAELTIPAKQYLAAIAQQSQLGRNEENSIEIELLAAEIQGHIDLGDLTRARILGNQLRDRIEAP